MNSENLFIEIIQQNEALILKVVSIYCQHREERRDLYQEIVMQLWRGFQKFEGKSKTSTWIYRVALNTAISGLRKSGRSPERSDIDLATMDIIEPSGDHLQERISQLYTAIADLNDLEKAITLLYLEEKSHTEIAEITGLSLSNVGTRFARIKEKLRNKMTQAK